MNILSLFDGMSCGQIALDRAGIKYDNYYASEIDKYAIQITMKNYSNTIQLGDITKWREWNLPQIDLLIGGSPCQGFSIAGAGLNFDDPRSKLFFDYIDILNYYKPTWFLLENVKMKKEWKDIISKYMGVEPIEINSALMSAQNRKRLYWTNIPDIKQPEDKHLYLKDIIEEGDVDREKSYTIDANYFKGGNPRSNFEDGKRQLVFGAAIRNQVTKRGIEEQLNIRKDEKSNAVVPSYPHKLNGMVRIATNVYPSGGQNGNVYEIDGKSPSLSAGIGIKGRGIGSSNAPKILLDGLIQIDSLYKNNGDAGRVYSIEGKGRTLKGEAGGGGAKMGIIMDNNFRYRKLTPLECERLQTVPDGYTEGVSDTQRYKMLGNGWTVDVIAHILKGIKDENWNALV